MRVSCKPSLPTSARGGLNEKTRKSAESEFSSSIRPFCKEKNGQASLVRPLCRCRNRQSCSLQRSSWEDGVWIQRASRQSTPIHVVIAVASASATMFAFVNARCPFVVGGPFRFVVVSAWFARAHPLHGSRRRFSCGHGRPRFLSSDLGQSLVVPILGLNATTTFQSVTRLAHSPCVYVRACVVDGVLLCAAATAAAAYRPFCLLAWVPVAEQKDPF